MNVKHGDIKEVDEYLFTSMESNARRLEDDLGKAIGDGVWDVIVGYKEHSVEMHAGFIQALAFASTRHDDHKSKWLSEHLIMGLARLLDSCASYLEQSQPDFSKQLKKTVSPEIKHRAYTYLAKLEAENCL